MRTHSLICAVALLGGCTAGTTAPDSPASPAPPERVDVGAEVDALTAPTIVSHRGAALRFPEQSMEGFEASAADGFLPEMDLHALADGTLVPSHDNEVDRTMRGVSGAVAELTPEDWAQASIVSPDGSYEVPAPTWEEVLDGLGGEIVLVPELKASGADAVEAFIDSVEQRDLTESIVAQSFDREVTREFADAGLHTLRLLRADEQPTPEQLVADGVDFVGPPLDVDPAYVASLQEAGLTVWVYTVTDADETATAVELGADGVFSDDPWVSAEVAQ